jgi:hypothetical protein
MNPLKLMQFSGFLFIGAIHESHAIRKNVSNVSTGTGR